MDKSRFVLTRVPANVCARYQKTAPFGAHTPERNFTRNVLERIPPSDETEFTLKPRAQSLADTMTPRRI